jgi:hypothetical protein
MGDYKLAQEEQLSTFIFPLSLKKILSAFMENTGTIKKRQKVTVNNGTT